MYVIIDSIFANAVEEKEANVGKCNKIRVSRYYVTMFRFYYECDT